MTFYCSILLTLFVVFLVSSETATKHGKFVTGEENKKGATFAVEFMKLDGDMTAKKSLLKKTKKIKKPQKKPQKTIRTQPTDPGYVYVMKENSGDGYIKIGFAINPSKRRGELQSGNAREIKLVLQWEVTNMLKAEQAFHAAMDKYKLTSLRQSTEWFSPPNQIVKNIENIGTKAMAYYLQTGKAEYPNQ